MKIWEEERGSCSSIALQSASPQPSCPQPSSAATGLPTESHIPFSTEPEPSHDHPVSSGNSHQRASLAESPNLDHRLSSVEHHQIYPRKVFKRPKKSIKHDTKRIKSAAFEWTAYTTNQIFGILSNNPEAFKMCQDLFKDQKPTKFELHRQWNTVLYFGTAGVYLYPELEASVKAFIERCDDRFWSPYLHSTVVETLNESPYTVDELSQRLSGDQSPINWPTKALETYLRKNVCFRQPQGTNQYVHVPHTI